MDKISQERHILSALMRGEEITPMDALKRWGCFRLGGRIHNIRQKGYDVQTRLNDGDKKYAIYSIKMIRFA